MKKILHIISSPRTEASVSRKLGNAVMQKIKEKYPENVVKERDLARDHFPHLEESNINSFFTPADQRSPEQQLAVQLSDEVIAELHEADIIVVDTSMYNFSIPSQLKAWIDHISRAGHTFRYTEKGPEGLLKNKKLYIAFSGGAVYSEGVFQAYDFNVPYIKALFNFFGVTDISVFRAEGLNTPVVQDRAFQKGVESIAID
jgi:FMN-dependent NADH-azoreductase